MNIKIMLIIIYILSLIMSFYVGIGLHNIDNAHNMGGDCVDFVSNTKHLDQRSLHMLGINQIIIGTLLLIKLSLLFGLTLTNNR